MSLDVPSHRTSYAAKIRTDEAFGLHYRVCLNCTLSSANEGSEEGHNSNANVIRDFTGVGAVSLFLFRL